MAQGLEAVRDQLAAQSVQVAIFQGDVSDSAVIEGVVALALERFGRIDVVFNNAGIMPIGDLVSFAETTWDQVMDVNVKSMYLMCKAVLPHMLARGSGSIINTSSVMATLTEPGYEAYTSSKAAVIGLTKAIAVSYAEQGVRCNCVCPGWVDTPLNQRLADSWAAWISSTRSSRPSSRSAAWLPRVRLATRCYSWHRMSRAP